MSNVVMMACRNKFRLYSIIEAQARNVDESVNCLHTLTFLVTALLLCSMLSELVESEQVAAVLRGRCSDTAVGLPPLVGKRLADETDD